MPVNIDVYGIQDAVIDVGLDRDVLLSGIDRGIVYGIPGKPTRKEQILTDLQHLVSLGKLPDGTWPLQHWLTTAAHLSRPRREEAVFRRALANLESPEIEAQRDIPMRDNSPRGAPPKLRIYLSAHRADDSTRIKLRTHLASLSALDVEIWDRFEDLRAGELIQVADQKFAAADLVIALLSAEYLADPALYKQVLDALNRRKLIPVLTRPCLWQVIKGLKDAQILPKNEVAITASSKQDAALVEVALGILTIVNERLSKGSSHQPTLQEAHEDTGAGQASMSFYDHLSYPFSLVAAQRIRDTLVDAYIQISEIQQIGSEAGVSLGDLRTEGGAARPAWNSLLDIATKQNKLRNLIEKVLSDSRKVKFHPILREALRELGVSE